MKKTKIFAIFASLLVMMCAVVLYSCSNKTHEVAPNVGKSVSVRNNKNALVGSFANTIANDPLYVSYIKSEEAINLIETNKIASFDAGTTAESLQTLHQNLLIQNDYDGIAQLMGYANRIEYLQIMKDLVQKYDKLLAVYPNFESIAEKVYDAYLLEQNNSSMARGGCLSRYKRRIKEISTEFIDCLRGPDDVDCWAIRQADRFNAWMGYVDCFLGW